MGSQRAGHDLCEQQRQNSLLNTSLCSSDLTGEEDGMYREVHGLFKTTCPEYFLKVTKLSNIILSIFLNRYLYHIYIRLNTEFFKHQLRDWSVYYCFK